MRGPKITTLLGAFAMMALVSGAPAVADAPLVVEIVVAELLPGTVTRSITGEFEARDELTLSFATSGRVASITVDRGQQVAKGTVLARMDSIQQQQAVREAEAGLATAAANLQQAQTDMTRQQALLKRGATTRIRRDLAKDALQVAQGARAQAAAELDRARKTLADTVITAPADAIVTERHAEPGQVVGAAQPIVDLALGDKRDAVFDVPDVILTQGDPAGAILLSPIDRPGVQLRGHVREVSPLIDPLKGTVRVTVGVDDPAGDISFGEAVRGTVSFQAPARIALPFTAISANAGGAAVWVVDPASMTVHLRPITVLRYDTGRVVLAAGVKAGEHIVGRGANLLYPGRRVTALEAVK